MEGFKNVAVKRVEDELLITWSGEDLGKVNIYMAEDPDFTESAENLVATVEGAEYKVAVPKEKRVYFILKGENECRSY